MGLFGYIGGEVTADMKKRLLIGAAALFVAGTMYGRGEATERYETYIYDTYGENVEVDVSRDWKMANFKATFELERPPLRGTYHARTYGDGTIHDDVMPTYWVHEAESTIHARLLAANALTEAETVRATVFDGAGRGQTIETMPATSIFELNPERFLGVAIMLHGAWDNTDEQKQRVLDIIRLLEDDVRSIHFSFDGTPDEDDDFTERYLNVTQNGRDGEPSFASLQTIDDLNDHDRLYGFDETTFITEYRFDGTAYEE